MKNIFKFSKLRHEIEEKHFKQNFTKFYIILKIQLSTLTHSFEQLTYKLVSTLTKQLNPKIY